VEQVGVFLMEEAPTMFISETFYFIDDGGIRFVFDF